MQSYREEPSLLNPSLAEARTDEYSYRMPAAPRIVIPPPALSTVTLPDFKIERIAYGDGRPDSTDVDFLNEIDFKNLFEPNSTVEWSYEHRRQAQMVLPFLFLGPMAAARDKDFLQQNNITMVLAVRHRSGFGSKLMAGAFKVADELNIARDAIDLASGEELIAAFPHAAQIINEHLADTYKASCERYEPHPRCGNVLVFCESGNEKSAAVVAAYIMETLGDVNYVKAVQVCQAQRFCVNFDESTKLLLKTYWEILCARREVVRSMQQLNGGSQQNNHSAVKPTQQISCGNAGKRRLRDTVDDDVDMSEVEPELDSARFEGRHPVPFLDRMVS